MTTRIFLLLLFVTSFVYADVQVRDGLISADLQSEPLTQVLDRLRSQTGLHLLIDQGIAGKTVSASFKNLPLASAFKKMLEGTGINYAVMTGANGEPESIFIGASSKPGQPPRQLDSRPVNNRGMVTPVNPPIPIPQPQQDPNSQQQNKPYNPAVNVPTGGGFVPEIPKPDPSQDPNQQQPQEENPDDNSENN